MHTLLLMLGALLALSSIGAQAASFDDATQCPNGNGARADIVQCFTFDERLSSCTTGTETECWLAQGYLKPLDRTTR